MIQFLKNKVFANRIKTIQILSELLFFRKIKYYCILIIISLCSQTVAQIYTRANIYKKYKKEFFVSLGVTQFLGDLGGLNKKGTPYSPADIDASLTKSAIGIGYSHKISRNINVQGVFTYLIVAGDDKLTNDYYRNNRNLNFKSNIFELTARVQIPCIQKGTKFKFKLNGIYSNKISYYETGIFAGIGLFYFNPKGKDTNGNWIELKPLHTEGQGLPNAPKEYSNFAMCLPMGAYYKVIFKNNLTLGVNFTYRKLFTDYLDDVSSSYYPNRALQQQEYGVLSVQMADPSKGIIDGATANNTNGTGAQRGNKQKDSYASLELSVGFIFKEKGKKRKLRSKF